MGRWHGAVEERQEMSFRCRDFDTWESRNRGPFRGLSHKITPRRSVVVRDPYHIEFLFDCDPDDIIGSGGLPTFGHIRGRRSMNVEIGLKLLGTAWQAKNVVRRRHFRSLISSALRL